MKLSLRNRLLFGMIAGLTCLLLVSGMLVYVAAKRSLYSQCDAAMTATAQMLSASVEDQDGKLKFELDVAMTPRFQKIEHPDYYMIELPGSPEAVRSPSLDEGAAAYLHSKLDRFGFRSVLLPNGQYVRTLRMSVETRNDPEDEADKHAAGQTACVLVLARDITELKSNLDSLEWLLFISGAITVALSVAVAVTVVDRGLRPVKVLAADIDRISDRSLETRLATDTVPVELVPVVWKLNVMLARLEESFIRQRRFSADVAHELRTPLAGLYTNLEVAMLRFRSAEEYRQTLSTCLPIVHSMQMIVANLLELTRSESMEGVRPSEAVRISEVVDSCWKAVAAKASGRSLSFVNGIPADMTFIGDRAKIAMIVSNAIDNAVDYADAGGRIWTESQQTDVSSRFSICNTGCALAPDDVERVFDCFWRNDKARTDTGLHCGLGLSIVRKLTDSLGGIVAAETRPGGIFALTFSFPSGNRESRGDSIGRA
jgi:two-component system, OmpR family, heavy metal sensor histidine kinase CusS